MKNKIILLLVLLIPSLGFSRSIKINVYEQPKELNVIIEITDSKTKSKNRFTFVTGGRSGNILKVKDNLDSVRKIDSKLKDIFGNNFFYLEDDGEMHSSQVKDRIIQYAVYADYQITFLNLSEKVYSSFYSDIFIYK